MNKNQYLIKRKDRRREERVVDEKAEKGRENTDPFMGEITLACNSIKKIYFSV